MVDQRGRIQGVAVIGLGRFGRALALELAADGTEVLGIDASREIVQELSSELAHLAVADSTNEEALRQLSVHEFRHVVVAIGADVEASILTTSLVLEFGVPNVWVKATTAAHGRIVNQLGAHHVVFPEHDMGRRVAHLVKGRMLDFVEFEDDFAIVKTIPTEDIVDMPLGDSRVRSRYDVTVVAVKHPGESFTYATADTVLHQDDVIIVVGDTDAVEKFSESAQPLAARRGPQQRQ